jgi:hypothetical protein
MFEIANAANLNGTFIWCDRVETFNDFFFSMHMVTFTASDIS